MLRVAMTSILLVALLACGGDPSSDPTQGSIKVRVASSGSPPDPDGFFLVIDPTSPFGGEYFQPEGQTITFTGIPAGEHELELQNVAQNCAVTPSAFLNVEVIADQTISVVFTVTCGAG